MNFTSFHTEVCLSDSFVSHAMVFTATIQYTQTMETVAIFITALEVSMIKIEENLIQLYYKMIQTNVSDA